MKQLWPGVVRRTTTRTSISTGTPLYIDGVIYVSTAWSKVYAFDAKTGKQLWQYDPKIAGRVDPQRLLRHRQSRHRRLQRQDLSSARSMRRLVAIDAKTGKVAW